MPRQIMPLADSRDLARQMELEKGFDTAAAKVEADPVSALRTDLLQEAPITRAAVGTDPGRGQRLI